MIRRFALSLLLLTAFIALPVRAEKCSLTITSLGFGNYNGATINSTAVATVKCSSSWSIALNAGTGAGATINLRQMTGPGGATLGYQLFQDSARSINWGNTSSTDVSGTGNTTINVYGRIPSGQFVVPGTYTDTVSSASSSFTITAVVQPTCSISAGGLAFGTYSGLLVNSTSNISVTCTKTTSYNVGLSAGTATGSTVANRSMKGPNSALLGYKLFSNTGRTANWGNTVGKDTVASVGTGVLQTLTVYGQIPAGELVAPGSYTDTITATLTY